MQPLTNLPSYSAANVGTPTLGQQQNQGSGLGTDRSGDRYWTNSGSIYDIGRPLDQSQLNSLQAMYGAGEDFREGPLNSHLQRLSHRIHIQEGLAELGLVFPLFIRVASPNPPD